MLILSYDVYETEDNMDWLRRMNSIIDYIEQNLDGKIDYKQIGLLACCPTGLFQRVFANIIDISLSEYIRRRRLTLAAFDLQTTAMKIIDIAIKYDYDSSDAFRVAFKRMHGITPTNARNQNTILKSYPKLSFLLSIKGDIEMNYKIVEKEAFTAIGKVLATTPQSEDIPKFWGTCREDGTLEKLMTASSNPLLGICFYKNKNNDDTFNYMIGIESQTDDTEEMHTLIIPSSTWAVFSSIGPMPNAIKDVWTRIFQEFLPSSTYAHAGTPDFELYYEGNPNAEDYHSEVWIPVVKK